jgi:hypothetical protein
LRPLNTENEVVERVHPARSLPLALGATAIAAAALAIGFASQASWATGMWPFETGRLSNFFLAAILAAIAVSTLWVSATRDWGALRASALFPFLALSAIAVYLVVQQASGAHSGLVPFAIGTTLAATYALALMLAGARVELQHRRPLPRLIRVSFVVFAAVLATAGVALTAGADDVIPWPVGEESLVIFGFVFLGAAASYLCGALRPVWGYAYAPLLGFLAYDVLLLPPLVGHFSDVSPDQRASLILYVGALLYSAALASYYLLIRRDTRLWARRVA